MGKKGTIGIEQNNSNIRHYLKRFNRRTKVISHSKEMIDISLKLCTYMNKYDGFQKMDIILSLNGGRLNYRTEGRRSYFLIGKNRVDGLYPLGESVYHFGVKLN